MVIQTGITTLPSGITIQDYSMIDCLVDVFNKIMKDEKSRTSVEDVCDAIRKIRQAYRNISMNPDVPYIDYDQSAFRCAYIYIDFVCHTSMVWNRVRNFSRCFKDHYLDMMKYDRKDLNICSLGGGPGCDIIGLLGARSEIGRGVGKTSNIRCTVVDLYKEWEMSFRSCIDAFVDNPTGKVYRGALSAHLIRGNLCKPLTNEVMNAITNADILTLVRYVSVVSGFYDQNRHLLKSIFECLKTGAYVIYIDNSIQRLYRMVLSAADGSGLKFVSPRKYCKRYLSSKVISRIKTEFNAKPLRTATVFCCIWQKQG